jgi:dienelactone hydrolase
MWTYLRVLAWIVAASFILTVARLAQDQKRGPAHSEVMLPGLIPGTFYLPGPGGYVPGNPFLTPFPRPLAERPPAVVLVHGFTADRETMSSLARKIAQNGYGVLAIDLRGHGENRNPFSSSEAAPGGLRPDVKAAVDFVRSSDRVDGSRVAVIGHSMGAGAVLDYASNDPELKAVIMISGGFNLGPVRPKNALFIFAQHDPDFIQDLSKTFAAHLAGVQPIALGKLYGDYAHGNAVEAIQMPGLNHVTILNSNRAADTIVKWLDSSLGAARTGDITLEDPRPRLANIASWLLLILLVPIGRIAGSIASGWPERESEGGRTGIAILAAALIVAMPLVANNSPVAFMSLIVADRELAWLGVAGVAAIAVLVLWRRLEWRWIREGIGVTLVAAALAFATIYICQNSYWVTLHRLALTPERMVAWIIASLVMLPFWLGFEFLVRRGGIVISTVLGAAGRVVIVVLLFAGAAIGIFPAVLFLIVPLIIISFLMLEVFAASAYATSRNLFLIALVETMLFTIPLAAVNPITFMF